MPRARAKDDGFDARFAGFCAHGDWITPGDRVRYTESDEVEHVECAGAPGQLRERAACPICNLTACDHEPSERAAWKEMG